MEKRRKAIDRRKVSVYLPDLLLEWVEAQHKRLGRSTSWLIQRALLHSREWIGEMPSLDDHNEPSSLSEEDVERIATRVAEKLASRS